MSLPPTAGRMPTQAPPAHGVAPPVPAPVLCPLFENDRCSRRDKYAGVSEHQRCVRLRLSPASRDTRLHAAEAAQEAPRWQAPREHAPHKAQRYADASVEMRVFIERAQRAAMI